MKNTIIILCVFSCFRSACRSYTFIACRFFRCRNLGNNCATNCVTNAIRIINRYCHSPANSLLYDVSEKLIPAITVDFTSGEAVKTLHTEIKTGVVIISGINTDNGLKLCFRNSSASSCCFFCIMSLLSL